jgi:hypothetical protein
MPGKYLADEISFRGPIPDDILGVGIRGKLYSLYDPLETFDRETGKQLDNNQLLRHLLKNTDIDILLKTLGNAFFPRQITVAASPTRTPIIEPNRYPRGYILINPNTTVSGVVTTVTVFPAGTVFPVGTTLSASINVEGHRTARFFLDVTEVSAGPVEINLQTQDPVTGNWATAQTDIFAGAGGALGTFYATVGEIGVDQNMRLQVIVAGDSMTASIGAILKEAFGSTIAGPTVFLGNADVNTTIGYPLLSGQRETIYLRENTPLFGIAVAATDLRLFELQ